MFTIKELLLTLEKRIHAFADEDDGYVKFTDIQKAFDGCIYEINSTPKRVEKFIFVEDGSVDTDELEERLAETNPEIKVVVYRQGASAPELVEVK